MVNNWVAVCVTPLVVIVLGAVALCVMKETDRAVGKKLRAAERCCVRGATCGHLCGLCAPRCEPKSEAAVRNELKDCACLDRICRLCCAPDAAVVVSQDIRGA